MTHSLPEPLSRKDVKQLYRAYRQALDNTAQASCPVDASPELHKAIKEYIRRSARLGAVPAIKAWRDIVAQGPEAVMAAAQKVEPPLPTEIAQIYRKYGEERKESGVAQAFFGKRQRIYFPLIENIQDKVAAILRPLAWHIENYSEGIAVTTKGGKQRKLRIGNLLKQHAPDLLKKFSEDQTRVIEGLRQEDLMVVLSRNPIDIARMSTGRSWDNCMHLFDGKNKEYVQKDIQHGSVVAYLTLRSDPDIRQPLSRIMLRPLISLQGETALFAHDARGIKSPAFEATVKQICRSKLGAGKPGYWKVHPDVLKNNGIAAITVWPEDTSAKNAGNILDLLKIKWELRDGRIFIPGDLNLSEMHLKILPDFSEVEVGGRFLCDDNKLTSLIGSPQRVGSTFSCRNNHLTSLMGAPPQVPLHFWANGNQLTSAMDAPITGGDLNLSDNKLFTLEGLPPVGGVLYCDNNPLSSDELLRRYNQHLPPPSIFRQKRSVNIIKLRQASFRY